MADLERTVGMPALAQIRSGGMLFVRAANEGRTVIEMFPKEKITEDFDALADRLLGTPTPVASAQAVVRAVLAPEGRRPRLIRRSRTGRGLDRRSCGEHRRQLAQVVGPAGQRLRSCQDVPPSGAPGSFCGFSPVRRSICSTPRR